MVYISERPRDTFSLWPQVGSECVLYSLYIAYAKKKTLKKKRVILFLERESEAKARW